MLNINPKMVGALERNRGRPAATTRPRRTRRVDREIEGIELTSSFLRHKRDQTQRLARLAPEPTLLTLEPTHSTRPSDQR
ncbi:hypothetical protein ACWDYH_24890 [Nocardia goodfellowii]